jgi:hypothetical protein
MITPEALEIVLNMAKERCGKNNQTVTTTELEAIEEVEFLVLSYDDMYEGYDEDELY